MSWAAMAAGVPFLGAIMLSTLVEPVAGKVLLWVVGFIAMSVIHMVWVRLVPRYRYPLQPSTRRVLYLVATAFTLAVGLSLVLLFFIAERGPARLSLGRDNELHTGFITWLQSSPDVRRQYEDGDDKKREAIMHQYLENVLRVAAPASASQHHDEAYWTEIGKRVLKYMAQRVGPTTPQHTDELQTGFIEWLQRSPDIVRQYKDGDDRKREAIVDQYLETVLAHHR